jgi:uncharacterized protein (DUF302 family)
MALPPLVGAAEGLTRVASPVSAAETMERFVALVEQRGLTVFARIDHAAGAAEAGETLRPTELLIFGSPRAGTPFMECAQTVGIDLPMKVLVWEDAESDVWVGYTDPASIAERHNVPDCAAVQPLSEALRGLAEAATKP